MMAIAEGLYVCSDLKKGEKLVGKGLESRQAEAFLSTVFEVGRRHKIMNPAKMRSSYGKLMYMLQDGMGREGRESIGGVQLWKPLNMVHTFLQERNAIGLLRDARIKVVVV